MQKNAHEIPGEDDTDGHGCRCLESVVVADGCYKSAHGMIAQRT